MAHTTPHAPPCLPRRSYVRFSLFHFHFLKSIPFDQTAQGVLETAPLALRAGSSRLFRPLSCTGYRRNMATCGTDQGDFTARFVSKALAWTGGDSSPRSATPPPPAPRPPGLPTQFVSSCISCISTLEATQGQILSQFPTDATQLWWHLYGS